MNYYKFLNESFDRKLDEAKQDEINFVNVFGEDMLNRFKAQKQRLSAPENGFYHWIGKAKKDLEGTIEELDRLLANLESTLTRSQKRRIAEAGADILYDDADWLVLKINTYEAAKLYGAGSVWCITGRYQGHEDRGEYYFDRYKEDNGWDYYFYIKKDGRDIEGRQEKWCLCWDGSSNSYEIWEGDQRERGEEQVDYIPGAPQVPGLPDVSVPGGYEDEYDDEEDGDWDEDDGERPEPAPREPDAFVNIEVEDPNDFEFPANSKEDAARQFKDDAEVIETLREPDLHIVKWHEEPSEEGDTGDRYSLFVFFPGEGGGPLLAQTGNGFALQVFKDLDKIRQFAGRMPGVEIRNNRQDTEDMPECLRENFYYYNDNSWFYDL